jgi:hypothetical protein
LKVFKAEWMSDRTTITQTRVDELRAMAAQFRAGGYPAIASALEGRAAEIAAQLAASGGAAPAPVETLSPRPPEPAAPALPPAPAPAPAPAPPPLMVSPATPATPAAPITREAAASHISTSLEECLVLVNVLSACLPAIHNAGRGTAAALAPVTARLNALLAEAGAEPVLPSRNFDFFNPTMPAVSLMGIEIAGGLAEDAAQILADARAVAVRQRDRVLAYAIAHPVGLVTRIRDAFDGFRAGVRDALVRLASVPSGAAERLSNFLLSWQRQFDASWTSFTNGVQAVLYGGAAVGAAGTGILLALALLVFLVLRK